MHKELLPLAALLQDMLPCLEYGLSKKLEERLSAHEKLILIERLEDAKTLARYQWVKGPITAYSRMASLTPLLQIGISNPPLRTPLKDKGYTDIMRAWRTVFTNFGMTAVHANTGIPCFPRSLSC